VRRDGGLNFRRISFGLDVRLAAKVAGSSRCCAPNHEGPGKHGLRLSAPWSGAPCAGPESERAHQAHEDRQPQEEAVAICDDPAAREDGRRVEPGAAAHEQRVIHWLEEQRRAHHDDELEAHRRLPRELVLAPLVPFGGARDRTCAALAFPLEEAPKFMADLETFWRRKKEPQLIC
jgi:hypothetical protein